MLIDNNALYTYINKAIKEHPYPREDNKVDQYAKGWTDALKYIRSYLLALELDEVSKRG